MVLFSKFLSIERPAVGCGVRSLARGLLDLVIPPRCAGCGKVVERANHLCGDCWHKMDWIVPPYCPISGLPFSHDLGTMIVDPSVLAVPPFYDRARSVALFGETARRMVHQLKYHDRVELATVMGRWMARAGADCLADPEALVVPVPLHRRRLWRRGFNQSALLAKVIAEEAKRSYLPDLLQRTRSTLQQVGLNDEERRQNVEGAFRLSQPHKLTVAGRTVVLVDDVWTTGATLESCCRVLRRAGAKEIDIITFSRVAGSSEIPI
ncbi:ComF family protein [uncultured Cohaesibacter sp.]|uniref:ComF family protein n=1 Tax=uncultured Cohaesibacter sp. TaxID=1002546 RepID=UPI0029304C59|nr:ComF family protein [uncultured Cohaesibacter sp.]